MAKTFFATSAMVCSDSGRTNVTGKLLTICAWARRTSSSGANKTMVAKRNGAIGGPNSQYFLRMAGSGFPTAVFGIYDNTATLFGVNSSVTLEAYLNTWVHLCGVYDGVTAQNMKFYVNGVLTNTSGVTTANMVSTLAPFKIGAEGSGGVFPTNTSSFLGNLAEIAVWNTPLTATEVANLYNGMPPLFVQTPFLCGYWPLNSTTGGVTYHADLSGYNDHAYDQYSLGTFDHPFHISAEWWGSPYRWRKGPSTGTLWSECTATGASWSECQEVSETATSWYEDVATPDSPGDFNVMFDDFILPSGTIWADPTASWTESSGTAPTWSECGVSTTTWTEKSI